MSLRRELANIDVPGAAGRAGEEERNGHGRSRLRLILPHLCGSPVRLEELEPRTPHHPTFLTSLDMIVNVDVPGAASMANRMTTDGLRAGGVMTSAGFHLVGPVI